MSVSGTHLRELAVQVVSICQLASDAIKEVYYDDKFLHVEYKGDSSPVTEADKAAHTTIVGALSKLTPGLPILSEEQDIPDYQQRRQWMKYWLVDPLDGTKEFISRNGEFTVNIALIERGRPVLGVVYVPLEESAYCGAENCGAWKINPDGETPLHVSGVPEGRVRVLMSSRHRGKEMDACVRKLRLNFGDLERIESGSALKFCRLAEGRGDIYPRFSPCCEWDTAAGQAVLEGAGGELLTIDFQRFLYNQKESVINPHFYAIGGQFSEWQSKLT